MMSRLTVRLGSIPTTHLVLFGSLLLAAGCAVESTSPTSDDSNPGEWTSGGSFGSGCGLSSGSGGASNSDGTTFGAGGDGTLDNGGGNGAGGSASGGAGPGSGGSDAGSGGASSTYEPCPPAPEPCRIMASGDSITVGAQSTETGGYRVPLFELAHGAGKHFTFVGPSGAGPETVVGVPFPDFHDGHSGYIIEPVDTRKGLLPLVAQNVENFEPHIVLLMIGTNDMNSDIDVDGAPERLEKVIDAFTNASPEMLLVVAQLIPTRADDLNETVQDFNSAIALLVEERVAAGKHVVMVDMYSAFTDNSNYKDDLLFDGLHPNDDGYAVMADVWWEALESHLN